MHPVGLAADGLPVHLAARNLQQDRVEIDLGQQVDQPDDQFLVERNVRMDERRHDRLPRAERGQREQPVLIREDVGKIVAEFVELGEELLAQAEREPNVPFRIAKERRRAGG